MLARVGLLDPQQLLHLSLSNGSTLCIQTVPPYLRPQNLISTNNAIGFSCTWRLSYLPNGDISGDFNGEI